MQRQPENTENILQICERKCCMKISLQNWLILLLLSLTWGSSFILIKQGLVSFSPFQVGALRMTIAAGFLSIWGFRNLTAIPKSKLKWVIIAGANGNFIPMFLFPIAQTRVSSSMAGILDSLVPIFVLLFGSLFFRQKTLINQVLGAIVGFIGAVLLIGFDGLNGENSFWHCLLIILATAMYGMNSLIITNKLYDIPPFRLSTSLFTIWLFPALIILFFSGFFENFVGTQVQWRSLGYVVILGFIGTALAMMLFYRLIQSTGAIFASMVTYLMPVVSVFWGIMVGENITWIHLIGFVLILVGVYLIQLKNAKNQLNSCCESSNHTAINEEFQSKG